MGKTVEESLLTDPHSCCRGGTGVTCGTLPGNSPTVTHISWNRRGLSGAIPEELSQLLNLTGLGLEGNFLSGSVPSSLGKLVKLRALNLGRIERLSGTFPQEIADLTKRNLGFINLGLDVGTDSGKNALKCNLKIYPNIGTGKLAKLHLSRRSGVCKFEYAFTDCYRALSIYKAMGKNNISDSDLSKSLLEPESCCNGRDIKCEGDAVVELNWQFKSLRGSINDTITELTSLKKWNLSSNDLSGGYPSSLLSASIVDLDLSNNKFSASVPLSYIQKNWKLSVGSQDK